MPRRTAQQRREVGRADSRVRPAPGLMRSDYVQRFLFEDLEIRGRLVCLTAAWQRMVEGRDYPPRIAELLGHTVALSVLLGANQKGRRRVTLQLQSSGPVTMLTEDCTPELTIV